MSTSTINLQAEKMALIDLISNVNSISVIKSLKRSFERTLAKAGKKKPMNTLVKKKNLKESETP